MVSIVVQLLSLIFCLYVELLLCSIACSDGSGKVCVEAHKPHTPVMLDTNAPSVSPGVPANTFVPAQVVAVRSLVLVVLPFRNHT